MRQKFMFVVTYAFGLVLLGMAGKFVENKSWFLGFFFVISSGLIIYVYAISKKIPGKYLVPGLLLLVLFHIYPAFYSGVVAFTNDSNGHQLSKTQAIDAIITDSKIPVQGLAPIKYSTAQATDTKEMYLIFQFPDNVFWAGNSDSLVPLNVADVNLTNTGEITKATGFRVLTSAETVEASSDLQNIVIELKDGIWLTPSDLNYLEASKQSFRYSTQRDELIEISTGTTYHPNDNGQMVGSSGELLYPGWKVNVGWRNFTSVVRDEEIRRPLAAVLAWTLFNAILIVVIGFLFGLILALTFNSPHLRSKRIYRMIFIVPLAIPSVLSVLVWSGLFATNIGVIDRLLHIHTPWLTNSFWARIAVLIVELWITFPYMFLISTGAIQAIPNEIIEAAEIDGATALKSFSQIKLPLVLRTVAPLLVASLAMALNNFGVIYLLTGGGPIFPNSNGNAGATDILISYTYKLAFNSQEGNNYGLASALSILNFALIALISIYGLRRMKTMEGVN